MMREKEIKKDANWGYSLFYNLTQSKTIKRKDNVEWDKKNTQYQEVVVEVYTMYYTLSRMKKDRHIQCER